MKEIKFRVWDGKSMMYYDLNSLMLGEFPSEYVEKVSNELDEEIIKKELVFMQYTGLKDKNRKEIYEGDTVELSYESSTCWSARESPPYKGSVVYEKYDGYGLKTTDNSVSLYHRYEHDLEVLGNIYENPELLNNDK